MTEVDLARAYLVEKVKKSVENEPTRWVLLDGKGPIKYRYQTDSLEYSFSITSGDDGSCYIAALENGMELTSARIEPDLAAKLYTEWSESLLKKEAARIRSIADLL